MIAFIDAATALTVLVTCGAIIGHLVPTHWYNTILGGGDTNE